ncbi:MAG: nuclear transport factor 2 family protein [Bryobacteraceae bacterium]
MEARTMFKLLVSIFLAAVVLAPLAQAQNDGGKSLRTRIQRLEDQRDIQLLLNEYGRALDEHDWTKMMMLYTKDGVWTARYGSAKGPEAIKAMMNKNVANRPGSYHLFSNFIINVNRDAGTLWAHWTIVGNRGDNLPSLLNSGHYNARVVREGGRWKFANLTVFNDLPHVDNPESPK